MDVLSSVVQDYLKTDIPAFNVGDTVKVHVKIKEGNRERIQIFEGFVLKRQNGGIGETFTVRRIASGVGVEKTFPIHSPLVEKIEVVNLLRSSLRKKNSDTRHKRQGTGFGSFFFFMQSDPCGIVKRRAGPGRENGPRV